MTGHFCTCDDSSTEKLFVARCEALLSSTTKGANASQTTTTTTTLNHHDNWKSILTITLREDMVISTVSSK